MSPTYNTGHGPWKILISNHWESTIKCTNFFFICLFLHVAVSYCNESTRIAIIRARLGAHKLITSALPFLTRIGKERANIRMLYVGGTLRHCYKRILVCNVNLFEFCFPWITFEIWAPRKGENRGLRMSAGATSRGSSTNTPSPLVKAQSLSLQPKYSKLKTGSNSGLAVWGSSSISPLQGSRLCRMTRGWFHFSDRWWWLNI